MTITYVGAGTVSTGNNTSVTPGMVGGVAAGDLLLVAASIRNSGTGSPDTPTGWTPLTVFGNVAVFGRWYATGVTAPTVTFTGGVANADTQAGMVAFRGVSPDALTASVVATLLNASAQNITYPSLDVPGAGHAAVAVLWKQDDNTSVTAISGLTSSFNSSVTAGDDATLALQRVVQTTETDIAGASLSIVGGAAAISRAILFALKPAAAIAINVQDAYPPRVQVVLTGLTIGDAVDIYRQVAGQRTLVRAGHVDDIADTALVVVDAELPMGVPVSYVAIVEGRAEYATGATTYTLPGGKVALSDAITGQAAEVILLAASERTLGRDSARMRVGGRNVVVTGPAGQAEGSYDLFTETTTSHQNLLALLATATAATVQIRQPGVSAVTGDPYDDVDAYLTIDQWKSRRFSQDGSDPRRVVTVDYAETDGWAQILEARGFSYQQMVDAYSMGGDYADLAGDYATYLDLAQADFS